MPKISRFKRRNSDRSGFKFFEIELVKDLNFKVSGDEFDTPPPSKKSLGGEGDISQGETRATSDFSSPSTYATPSGYENPVFYITAAAGITPTTAHPFMQVSGSNSNIQLASTPQIVAGQEGQILSLLGVGSNITLINGSGVALMASARFIINSGNIITFMYNTANNAWNEMSRTNQGGF